MKQVINMCQLSQVMLKCNYHFHTSHQRNSRGYISHVYLTTGIHLNVHQCGSQESGCTSKGASHFHQSKNCLDVDGMSQFILYQLR